MKFVLSVDSFASYIVMGTPYTIIEVSRPIYNHKNNKFETCYNYWLTHKEYGHMMYMFGNDMSFHEFWDDCDPDYIEDWFYTYMKEIKILENTNEN